MDSWGFPHRVLTKPAFWPIGQARRNRALRAKTLGAIPLKCVKFPSYAPFRSRLTLRFLHAADGCRRIRTGRRTTTDTWTIDDMPLLFASTFSASQRAMLASSTPAPSQSTREPRVRAAQLRHPVEPSGSPQWDTSHAVAMSAAADERLPMAAMLQQRTPAQQVALA